MSSLKSENIGVFGKGKTGGKVIELLKKKYSNSPIIFDSQNPPQSNNLKNIKYIIAFVPSDVLIKYLDLFIENNISLISGATGMPIPQEKSDILNEKNLSWISGSNFSLGMRVIYELMKTVQKAKQLWPELDMAIHEVHHTQKLDGPSGTALSWAEWVGLSDLNKVTFDRVGDVVGDHQLRFDTGNELITIRHQALDRKLFAQGAIWALEQIEKNKVSPGLHLFEDITKNIF